MEKNEERFQRSGETLFEDIDDETVILNLKDGCYYGLNAVGRSLWIELAKACSRAELTQALKSDFPNENPQTLQSDINCFLEEMTTSDLVYKAAHDL